MNGSGFGICGHRNAYQSRVRHGNWVEDLIGIDLHAQGFERGKVTGDDYMTTSAGSYIHPADMVNKQDQGLAPPTMPDPNGLSYEMMFKHGKGFAARDDEPPPHAALGPISMKIGSECSNSKMIEREKELARAKRQLQQRTSEATANNKGVGEPSFKVAPVTKDGQAPAAMFNFHKSTKLSSGEDFY